MDACYKGTHAAPLEKPLALVLSLLSFLPFMNPFMVQCSVQEIPPLSVSVPMILLKSLLIFYILFNRQGQADLFESSLVYISNSRPTGLFMKTDSQKVKTKYV